MADFIHPRDCKPKCEKFLTPPEAAQAMGIFMEQVM